MKSKDGPESPRLDKVKHEEVTVKEEPLEEQAEVKEEPATPQQLQLPSGSYVSWLFMYYCPNSF